MSSPYEIRTNETGKSKKQSMAELKLRRLTELNQRLQEDLNRRRIPVSEAAMEYVVGKSLYMRIQMLTVIYSLIAFTDKEPKVIQCVACHTPHLC
jgi:guanine nucleotide-binding protein subunit gamma